MGDKVWLNMQELDEVLAGVTAAINDFNDVSSDNDRAEEAVARPDGRGELRGKVADFEDDWNRKRDKLKEGLEGIQEHLQGIIDGWRQFDEEAQAALTNDGPDNQTTITLGGGGPGGSGPQAV